MRSTSTAMRRPASLGLLGLALILALSLLVLLAAPQAQAATLRLDGMQTTLTTDPGTTAALWAAGIIPLPVAPSTVSPTTQAARYTFPITTGRVDAKTTAGFINHSGGLLLARFDAGGWTALNLTRFTINVTGAPNLTAIVNGAARVEIATLDLGSAEIKTYTKNHRTFRTVKNVGVTLNATAMGAINDTFGTSLPSEVKLGTADVLARVAR
ncbi:MAG: hypothetical protein NTX16_12615 [Actinobacteria bacterium]|nr:hypothetical protein [Actinomycetota bacterium]